jgi:glycosyltransferase 2 family protein
MYKREGVSESAVIGSTTLESLAVALAGVVVYLTLLPFYVGELTASALPVVIAGVILLGALSQPNWILRLVDKLFLLLKREPMNVTVKRSDVPRWLLVYALAWLVGGVGLFCMVNALYAVPVSDLAEIVGIATLATLVSLLTSLIPGGSILRELTLAALLGSYVPLSVGIVIAIAYRVWLTLLDLVWGLIAFRCTESRKERAASGQRPT